MTSDTGVRGFQAETGENGTGVEGAPEAGQGAAEAARAPSGFASPPDDASGEAGEGLDAGRLAALAAENADVKDRLLRLAADMENLRRRTEREIRDARTYAVTGFAREMLAVADNLRRAIEAVPAEGRAGGEADLSALVDGIEATERGLLAALEKNGVRKLEPLNGRFDPNFHQAMFEVPNPNVPANTVVQVVQDGYAIGDRVLRPAMVGVAKGGPRAAAANGEAPGQGSPQAGTDTAA